MSTLMKILIVVAAVALCADCQTQVSLIQVHNFRQLLRLDDQSGTRMRAQQVVRGSVPAEMIEPEVLRYQLANGAQAHRQMTSVGRDGVRFVFVVGFKPVFCCPK